MFSVPVGGDIFLVRLFVDNHSHARLGFVSQLTPVGVVKTSATQPMLEPFVVSLAGNATKQSPIILCLLSIFLK